MKLYTIEKNTMKAVKSILKATENASGQREWTRYAYLYSGGLILTDGRRLLKVHDADLEEEFGDFIRETGRVVTFTLNGNGLEMFADLPYNDSNVGTMLRLISPDNRFELGAPFRNRFSGTKATEKDISASMLNMAIIYSGRWFNPDGFIGMGIRPWSKVISNGESMVSFKTDGDEYFITMGLSREEG